ncbi:hypothetical protein BX616_002435 [Lobosporangium transversale]|nr:hypothetical protein BX616_002435 [Lobosporangium transversale]
MSEDRNNNNNNNNNNDRSGKPIYSVTMDPNALNREFNQATQALHSSVNSLLNMMHSSVFGGLESISKEISAFERNSKEFLENHPLQSYYQHHLQNLPFWNLRSDGPKKRYRITIEELPPLEEGENQGSSKIFSTSSSSSDVVTRGGKGSGSEIDEFTITQGKAGTPDEGKTVITTSVAPGLLDWLLFTTHEDSFFRRLGQHEYEHPHHSHHPKEYYDPLTGATIRELKESEMEDDGDDYQSQQHKRTVPALVEKVKQVGTSWERDARHWWQRKRHEGGNDQSEDKDNKSQEQPLDHQHHLFTGVSQSERDQEEERYSRRWPRGRTWGHTESYSQTTVTRPDGTVEHRTVNSINGETETIIKIQHPDGSVEETITRENRDDHSYNGSGGGFRDRWLNRRHRRHDREEDNEDRTRDSIAAMVTEAFNDEHQQYRK